MGNALRVFSLLAALFLLATCSLKTNPPNVSVRIALNDASPARQSYRGLRSPQQISDFNCFLVVFRGNGVDDFGDADTGGISHSCLGFSGKGSSLVTYSAALAGFTLNVPAGSYTAEVFGIERGSDCGSVTLAQAFSGLTPSVYSVGSQSVNVVGGSRIQISVRHDPQDSTDLAASCSPVVKTWSFVDGGTSNGINLNPANQARASQLVQFNSKLYSVWSEDNISVSHVRMAVFNGNAASPSWLKLPNTSTGFNFSPGYPAHSPQAAVFNSKLFIAWHEQAPASNNTIRVKYYNSDDNSPAWSDADGGTGVSVNTSLEATVPQLQTLSGKLYLAWSEKNLSTVTQVRIAVYTGTRRPSTWKRLDSSVTNGLNYSAAREAISPQMASFGGKLYATWTEDNGVANQIRVVVFNGDENSPAFTFVDGGMALGVNHNVSESGLTPQLAVHNGKLYATWSEMVVGLSQIRVAVYNGNDGSPQWSFVDGNANQGLNVDTTRQAITPRLTSHGAKLYLTWSETALSGFSQARVKVYNNNDASPVWTRIENGSTGLNFMSDKNAYTPQLVSYLGQLYATWIELTGTSSEVRVAFGRP